MAGTISFGGIGSGIDVEGIVTGLTKASSGQLNRLQSRASETSSAASTISEISGMLSSLETAVRALDEATETKTYSASSSSSAVAVSATGAAQPGVYSVSVESLASQARVYSNAVDDSGAGMGLTGTLSLDIAGESHDFELTSETTLDQLVSSINESGLRLAATTFYDGSQRRMVVTGLDKGADNVLTIDESDLVDGEGAAADLGLNLAGNIKSTGDNAVAYIDGFRVESASNQIVGSIPGVTLALTAETTEEQTITVDADPDALKAKLDAVVSAYNKVNSKIHFTSGYGDIKASNQQLAGDSALRSVTNRLSSALMTSVDTGTNYNTLASIGLSVGRDGSLSLDGSKLEAALAADPASVTQVLSGTSTSDGAMDVLRDLADSFTETGTGLLTSRKSMLNDRAKDLTERADREQTRLDRYAEQLRKQFSSVEGSIAGSYSDLDYLMSLFSG